MKKSIKILSTFILVSCIVALVAACSKKVDDIRYGSYYSIDEEDRYIVLTADTITLYNFDFSYVEKDIFEIYGEHVDVSQILVGEQSYDVSADNDIIWVMAYRDLAMRFHYNHTEKSLAYGDEKFYLREV